jgi:hypothetical protein
MGRSSDKGRLWAAIPKADLVEVSMTERRFVLVDFRYTSDVVGHIRLYEAGNTYDLAHAAARRELVAVEQPVHWEPPSIFRPPEVLTESELLEAGEL